MPTDIWRFFAGHPLLKNAPWFPKVLVPKILVLKAPLSVPIPVRPTRRARLFPRRTRRLRPGPVPGVAATLKILIVTDAWSPQVNGVVRTLQILRDDLTRLGHRVHMITPEGRPSMPLPTYPEIRLALFPKSVMEREIRDFAPDAVHIATEGSLGLAARHICLKHAIAFTTAFHTRFAE